jgi:hypothetical protein
VRTDKRLLRARACIQNLQQEIDKILLGLARSPRTCLSHAARAFLRAARIGQIVLAGDRVEVLGYLLAVGVLGVTLLHPEGHPCGIRGERGNDGCGDVVFCR